MKVLYQNPTDSGIRIFKTHLLRIFNYPHIFDFQQFSYLLGDFRAERFGIFFCEGEARIFESPPENRMGTKLGLVRFIRS